ncbi:Wzz/FepE/Etk N-terminal domain-containing protein [Pseudorhodobacter sp.]|uniref:Wzz/FepE/Etk N-terminal domain-containing protein n=1 Tax=Pseudorhodobacter sp. TaxID=1934400 RepID=UPI0039E6396C
MGKIQNMDELIGLLLRRRLLIGAVTVFGIVMTLLYVIAKPDVFESTALIQVQSPTVTSPDTAAGTAHDSSAKRLQAIQQQLTTRENMLAVIARHQLYSDLPLTDDEKVHLLRIALRFETVASAAAPFGQTSEVSALLISAQAETRAKAARVANDFAQGILDAGADGQMERAQEALGFFREEETRLKTQIGVLEAELAGFQAQNRDALPAQRELLRTELTGIETELRALDQALVAARNDRAGIERKATLRATDRRQLDGLIAQIDTLTAQGKALETRRAELLATLAKALDVDRRMDQYQRDLTQLQNQYAIVTRRSADAETDAKLQDRNQGETFSLLERAAEPDYPISGGRRKLAILGAGASLFLGVMAAFLLDQLHPVLRTRSQLERELDLRPIVAIPEIRSADQSLRQRFMSDLPKRPRVARPVPPPAPSARPMVAQQLGRIQMLFGGTVVILLVAMAVALT